MGFNLLSMVAQAGSIKQKAPALLSEFLDKLIEENRPLLNPEDGELQICYLMTQKGGDKSEYIIAIVALSGDNRVLRVLKSIPLSEALSSLLKNLPNA